MATLEQVLTADGRALARLLKDTFLDAGLDPARTSVATALLDRAMATPESAWPAAARCIWEDPGLRLECDRHPGLRTRVRSSAVGGVLPAITSLLAQHCAGRNDDGNLIAVSAGAVWIADCLFRELAYHLELDAQGRAPALCSPAGAAHDDAEGITSLPELWQRWIGWASSPHAPQRSFISHPRFIGSFPAWGLPAQSPRLAILREALRRHPGSGPLLVVGVTPALLPWLRSPLPGLHVLARGTGRLPWRLGDYRNASAEDAQQALLALLALSGERSAGRAVVETVRAAVMALLPPGTTGAGGVLELAPLHQPRLAPLLISRHGQRLLVNEDGVAAAITALGLFPYAYPLNGGPWSAPYRTLRRCGWQLLESRGLWSAVTVPDQDADPHSDSASAPGAGLGCADAGADPRVWIAFPAGRVLDQPQLGPLRAMPPGPLRCCPEHIGWD